MGLYTRVKIVIFFPSTCENVVCSVELHNNQRYTNRKVERKKMNWKGNRTKVSIVWAIPIPHSCSFACLLFHIFFYLPCVYLFIEGCKVIDSFFYWTLCIINICRFMRAVLFLFLLDCYFFVLFSCALFLLFFLFLCSRLGFYTCDRMIYTSVVHTTHYVECGFFCNARRWYAASCRMDLSYFFPDSLFSINFPNFLLFFPFA